MSEELCPRCDAEMDRDEELARGICDFCEWEEGLEDWEQSQEERYCVFCGASPCLCAEVS